MKATKKNFIDAMKKLTPRKEFKNALETFDRGAFLDPIFSETFYSDEAVPLGAGQRTDVPTTLVRMIGYADIKKSSRVLEVGTGSGYSAALLSSLAKEVVTIEIDEKLAASAKTRHELLRIRNTRFFTGDGTDPDESLGPFDAIIVWGACFARPLLLAAFLGPGGRLVFPMGPFHQQQIALYTLDGSDARTTFHEYCAFLPIHGRYGTDLLHRETIMANFSPEEGEEGSHK